MCLLACTLFWLVKCKVIVLSLQSGVEVRSSTCACLDHACPVCVANLRTHYQDLFVYISDFDYGPLFVDIDPHSLLPPYQEPGEESIASVPQLKSESVSGGRSMPF